MASVQPKKEPTDLWNLVVQQREKESKPFKPVFISRKQREANQREREEKERREKEEEAAKRTLEHEKWLKGPKANRGQKRPAPQAADKETGHLNEKEMARRREQYCGPTLGQSTFSAKKKRKRTGNNKFNFDWDLDDDTTNYEDPRITERAWQDQSDGEWEETKKKAAELVRRAHVNGDDAKVREHLEYMDRTRKLAIETKEAALKTAFGPKGLASTHWNTKKLEEMAPRDWRIFKEDFDISMKGGSMPNPMRYWSESGLPKRLLDVVAQVGYTEPTPVQRAAIPIALKSRDLIGVAATGSGKTAAFLFPLLVYISELPALSELTKNDGPYALILAPTRELAQQIEIEAKKFATPLGFTCVSIIGGHSLEEQAYNLRNGAEIIIATPGRLVDCIERRVLVLSQCCYVIMDEADRMIDLGFEEPVNKILDALPVENMKPDSQDAENARAMSRYLGNNDRFRQTMMYTATMPAAVARIAQKYLRRPAQVTIGNVGEAVDTVEQRVEFVSGEDRRKKRMLDILSTGEFSAPIIVFVNIKRNCDTVARDIRHAGFSSVTLHGSKSQDQREAALASVRNGSTEVLVATDVAGRGIDVPDVSLVLNFNMATNIENYTHRIGRTGRAGKTGVAITFLGTEDSDVLYDLKQMLSKSPRSRVPEELRKHEAAQQKPQRTQQRRIE